MSELVFGLIKLVFESFGIEFFKKKGTLRQPDQKRGKRIIKSETWSISAPHAPMRSYEHGAKAEIVAEVSPPVLVSH